MSDWNGTILGPPHVRLYYTTSNEASWHTVLYIYKSAITEHDQAFGSAVPLVITQG